MFVGVVVFSISEREREREGETQTQTETVCLCARVFVFVRVGVCFDGGEGRMRESVVGALVEASMASSAAAAMVRVVPGSQSDQAAEAAVHDKTLTADEYAQQALEKLFASPLFASSVCSSLSTSLHLLSLHLCLLSILVAIEDGRKKMVDGCHLQLP